MKNIEIPVIAISIRLQTQNTGADYYPFREMPEARFLFMKKLCGLCEADDSILDIEQLLNEIIVIRSGEKEEYYKDFFPFVNRIREITNFCNQYGEKAGWIHKLAFTAGADAGMSSALTIEGTVSHTYWTGLHADRASTLTLGMQEMNLKGSLVTHSFYKHLNAKTQNEYQHLYYIHHICCYGK